MSEVDRFIDELIELSEARLGPEDLKLAAQRRLLAFIGRVVVRDEGWAPAEEIINVLRDARARLQQTHASSLRVDLLTELDKAISAARPPRLPTP